MAYTPRTQVTSKNKTTVSKQFGPIIGVDFRTDECADTRTPNSVNMYRGKGGEWETHPGFRKIITLPNNDDGSIPVCYGIYKFIYTSDDEEITKVLIHADNRIYVWNNYPNNATAEDLTLINSGKPVNKSPAKWITFGKYLVILSQGKFYKYDGTTFSYVSTDAFIPQTYVGKDPNGANGTAYQALNWLSQSFIEGFVGDGTSTSYYLGLKNIQGVTKAYSVSNGVKTTLTVSSVDTEKGIVKFSSAPPKPDITGTENIYIEAKINQDEFNKNAKIITNCSEMMVFDNRIFLTGNPEYPNNIYWCGYNDFTYYAENMYSDKAGKGSEPIVGLQMLSADKFVSIKKDTSQDGSYCVFIPDETNEIKTYIGQQANARMGTYNRNSHCVFMDDNVFLSSNGLNAISRSLSISNERNIEHRSTLVDNKMLMENLESGYIEQFDGRLYILFPESGHIYIADALLKNQDVSVYTEYEWAYLENIGIYDENDVFHPARFLKTLGDKELFFGGYGYVCMFNFDMLSVNSVSELQTEAYSFNGRHIGDYVDTAFSWFNYSNRFKKLIRSYNDLYMKAKSRSNIQIVFRTEKSFISGSKVINFNSGYFDFRDFDFEDFTFNTLEQVSFALRKLKAKKFRRLQVRIRSAKVNRPFAFKAMVFDAEILNKKIK